MDAEETGSLSESYLRHLRMENLFSIFAV